MGKATKEDDARRLPGRGYTGVPWVKGKSPRKRTDAEVSAALAAIGGCSERGKRAMLAVLGSSQLSYRDAATKLGEKQGYVMSAILSIVNRLGGPPWMYDFEEHKMTLVIKDVPTELHDAIRAKVAHVVALHLANKRP